MVLLFIGLLLLSILISAVISFIPAGILYAIWNFVVLAIWPALPIIGFWQMYLVFLGLSIIGSLFKTSVSVSSK